MQTTTLPGGRLLDHAPGGSTRHPGGSVAAAHGAWMSARIPRATTRLLPEERHLSIEPSRAATMLAELRGPLG